MNQNELTNEEQIKTSSQKVKEQIGDVSMIVNFLIVILII